MAKVAVVILNYNGRDYLEKFLPSVIAHSSEASIIVADNASQDDSVAFLTSHYPEIQLIILEKNYGFAGGYNEALKKITADYFVLLNSDVEVSPDWLVAPIHFLDHHPTYAACQPKIKDYNNQSLFEYAGASGGFLDSLGYPYCRGRIFDQLEEDTGQYNNEIDIFWASGACMFIRSEIFFKAGGFDDDFFAHMEEIDLCWRIKSMGYKVKAIPDSVVYHVGGGTLSKSSPFKTYLNFRNGLNILVKNLPIVSLIIKFFARVVLDWVAAFVFLIKGDSKHSLSIIKAHAFVIKNFRKTWKKRTLTSDTNESTVLIYEHFIKGKKNYTNLEK